MAFDRPTLSVSHLADEASLLVWQGRQPGPCLTILGGVHGDEDEGVLAVRVLQQRLQALPLTGTVRTLAPAHPSAWAAHSRTGPLDGQDLARRFPGDPCGGPTPALAAAITKHVIEGSDLLIDLHSAGLRYSMPLFCGFARNTAVAESAREAALAFGAPMVWEHQTSPAGRTLTAAGELGVPAIYAECSGGGAINATDLDAYVAGALSVMACLGMVPSSLRTDPGMPTRRLYGGGDLDAGARATRSGVFVVAVAAGVVVAEGAVIGRIYDESGCLSEEVHAPRAGMVMFLRRHARIEAGDVLFALASLEDPER